MAPTGTISRLGISLPHAGDQGSYLTGTWDGSVCFKSTIYYLGHEAKGKKQHKLFRLEKL